MKTMGSKKIALIFPERVDSISRVFERFWLTEKLKDHLHMGKTNATLPMGLLMLASVTPPEFQVMLVDERLEEIDYEMDVDLVGISTVTRTALHAYEIADRFRERGVQVVLGGIHATVLPGEAGAHADSLVIGEGEDVWPLLLEDFRKGALKKVYRAEKSVSVEQLPLPRRDLLRLPDHYITTKVILATRGCPYRCTYCTIGTTLGKKYRKRPLEQIMEEIESIPGKVVIFVDDNLGVDTAYAKELFRALIPLRLKWQGSISMNALQDEELMDLMAQSGCTFVGIGLESIAPETLKEMGKLGTNSPEKYATTIKRLHDHGIAVNACFILGFDADPPDLYERLGDFILSSRIEIPNINTLIPYPGTPIYDRFKRENRLLTENWNLYDTAGGYVVYKPKNMSPEQLVEKYLGLTEKVFSHRSILTRVGMAGYFGPINFSLAMHYNYQKRRSIVREIHEFRGRENMSALP